MRKLIYTFGMIAAMAMTACSNPREAVIDGEMTAEGWNGKNIELINSETNEVISQTRIEDNEFEFRLVPDTPFIATLRIQSEDMDIPYILPVAVEMGKITVKAGMETLTTGTPLNTRLQQFMVRKSDLALPDTLSLEEYKKEFRAFIEQEIENNKDCPALAGFIKKAYLR